MSRESHRAVRDVAIALAVVVVAVFLTTRYLAVPWVVAGDSMTPTLEAGDRVVVELWSYRRRAPASGEIALFSGPGDVPMVKRVGAPPGRTEPTTGVWVLGDNPAASRDSRQFGPVPRDRFRGRVVWRYWPVSRAGSIR